MHTAIKIFFICLSFFVSSVYAINNDNEKNLTCYKELSLIQKYTDLAKSRNMTEDKCKDSQYCTAGVFEIKPGLLGYRDTCAHHDVCADKWDKRPKVIAFRCCHKDLCNGYKNLDPIFKDKVSKYFQSHITPTISTYTPTLTDISSINYRLASSIMLPNYNNHSTSDAVSIQSTANSLLFFWMLSYILKIFF